MTRSCRNFCLLLSVWIAAPLTAQEGPVTFEFSFSNPGARSMGLGGAFAALGKVTADAIAQHDFTVEILPQHTSVASLIEAILEYYS